MDKNIKKRIKEGISKGNIRRRISVAPDYVPKAEYINHIINSITSLLDSDEIGIVYIENGMLRVDNIFNNEG